MTNHPTSALRVLIVEDNANTRCAMMRLLERHGYSATATSTVATTLDLLLHEAFDIALIDLVLPDGHGSQIVAWLNQHAPRTAVTVLTGCNDMNTLSSLSANNGVRLLHKPIDFVDLLANIRKA